MKTPRIFGLAAALMAVLLVPAAALSQKKGEAAPAVTEQARKAGKEAAPAVVQALGANCQVSDARLAGKTAKGTVLLEVACSDKLPGYMIEYNTSPVSAIAATGCRFAGNCQLPTNKTP